MATRILLLGNVVAIALTIVGLLQLIAWPIAGILILTTLVLTTLISHSPSMQSTTVPASSKRPATSHFTTTDTRTHAAHAPEKQAPRSHMESVKLEQKAKAAPEHLKTVTANVSLSRSKVEPLKTVGSQQRLENLRSAPPSFGLPTPSQIGLTTPKTGPDMSPTITGGDYVSYDIELDKGKEVVAEVVGTGPLNVYILNGENLSSLDLGEEFWSEAGEEGVEKARLKFTAPERGKWFLVVENADSREVSATLTIQKRASGSDSS